MTPVNVATECARRLIGGLTEVIHGDDEPVRLVVTALLAGGHVLVDDLPGTGKTTLAKALAASISGRLSRIQATSDLMPADITGGNLLDPASRELHFMPGPVFANVVVIDELNRMPARTQSALMEALDEHTVHVDGLRHEVPDPFFVIATQNPRDHSGTYELPEGQLDRFALRISMPRLGAAEERLLVLDHVRRAAPLGEASEGGVAAAREPAFLVTLSDLRAARAGVRTVHVSDSVADYAVAIGRATREHPVLAPGVSARAVIALVRCAQGAAALAGRDFVLPEDVLRLAVPVLAHRVGARQAPGDAEAAVASIAVTSPVAAYESRPPSIPRRRAPAWLS